MDEFPFSALFLFAQSCLTDAVNVIFSDYCFTDTYLKRSGVFVWLLVTVTRSTPPILLVPSTEALLDYPPSPRHP